MPDESPDRRNPSPHLTFAIIEGARVLRALIWGSVILGVVYFGVTVPVRATVGQQTDLTVVYGALVNLNIHVIVSWAAVVLFFTLWRKERKTRIVAVERENRRNKELEERIDPGRTSSGFQENSRQTTSLGGV